MEEMNLTEEQTKKFWFKVGLHCDNIGWYIPILFNIKDAVPNYYISGLATPEIDLNNLFKWAVPKLEKSLELTVTFHRCHGNIWSCLLTTYKGDIAVEPAKHTNPAMALYSAIKKVNDNG